MNLYPTYHNGHLVDPFFDDFFGTRDTLESKHFGALAMKTDIRQEKNGYAMFIDMPGVKKENIELTYKDEHLTVSVTTESLEKDEEGKTLPFLHRERFAGRASRSYYVGDINEDKIKAEYKDGVLKVFIPNEEEEVKTEKKISIQ